MARRKDWRRWYSSYLLGRAEKWKRTLDAYGASVCGRLLQTLDSLKKETSESLAKANLKGTLTEDRERRLSAWLDSVAAAARTVTGRMGLESATQAAVSSKDAAYAMLSFDGASDAIADVGLTAEQVGVWFSEPILSGYTFGGALSGMLSIGGGAVLESVRESVVKGESVRKAVERALETGFLDTRRQAVTIVRTAIQAGAVKAMDAVYDANAELFSGWRWVAKLDTSACISCAALDGKIFPLGKGPRMPLHFRCRCLRQMILKSNASLGLPDSEVQRLSRTWLERERKNIDDGGRRKILDSGSTTQWYGEWMRSLPLDKQEAVLGPSRAGALLMGVIKWEDLVDGNGEMRTLAELGIDKRHGK